MPHSSEVVRQSALRLLASAVMKTCGQPACAILVAECEGT
jgi:hypothetical protein